MLEVLPECLDQLGLKFCNRAIFHIQAGGTGVPATAKQFGDLVDPEKWVFSAQADFDRTVAVFDQHADIHPVDGTGIIDQTLGIIESRSSLFVDPVFKQPDAHPAIKFLMQ